MQKTRWIWIQLPSKPVVTIRVTVGPPGCWQTWRTQSWRHGVQSQESALVILLGSQQTTNIILWSIIFLISSTLSCQKPNYGIFLSILIFVRFRILPQGNTDICIECRIGFYSCFDSYSLILHFRRRWKKEKEEWNLANGINFSYTSPYMADNCSIVKA